MTFFSSVEKSGTAAGKNEGSSLQGAPIPEEKSVVVSPAALVATRPPPPYKVKLPSFSGKPRKFQIFRARFEETMKTYTDYYTDSDKLSILAEAMDDSEAKKLVLNCYAVGYDSAMEELQNEYGRKSVIFPILANALVNPNSYDLSRESMKQVMYRTQRVLNDMEKLKAKDIELLAVSLVVNDFDLETMSEWSKHMSSDDVLPDMKTLMDFAVPRSHNLPRIHKKSPTVATANINQQHQQTMTMWKKVSKLDFYQKECALFVQMDSIRSTGVQSLRMQKSTPDGNG